MEENNVTLDMNDDRIEQERCVEKRSNNSLYQHLLYCCGTEGRTLKSAVRICVVENAVHFLLLWLVLFVVLLALIGSSTISLLTQNRHFQVIPYDGYNDTTPYHFDNEELVYFLQISDLHLSRNIPHVYDRFNQFLTVDLKSIDPHFVFVTGDITDQMLQTGYFNPITPSNNEPEQWQRYSEMLHKSLGSKYSPDFWIDFRGNHDNYEVPDLHSPFNYFVNYSVSSLRPDPYARVINYTYKTKKNSTYSFVAFDACPPVGMSAPMNFYGLLTDEIMTGLKEQVKITKNDNHTILMSHYPLSTLNIYGHPLRNGRKKLEDEILDEWRPTAYLSGHLHLAKMHDSNNFMLDLEIGDFMFHNYYRLMAYDNDLFSFIDTKLGKWPLVLVTNPKNDKHLSQKDKWQRMRRSTHIRSLIFSTSNITTIQIFIDDKEIVSMIDGITIAGTVKMNQKGLFEFSWKPEDFDDDRHKFRMIVRDAQGNYKAESFTFHLGGKARRLGTLYSNTVLTVNMQALFLFIFTIFYAYTLCVCLIFPKLILLVLNLVNQKYYLSFKARMKRNIYELCGTKELMEEIAESEHLPVVSSILPTPCTPLVTTADQHYGTTLSELNFPIAHPEVVPALASEPNHLQVSESSSLLPKAISTSSMNEDSPLKGFSRNIFRAQVALWNWIVQSFMWHTWKYMHMSNWWFIMMLGIALYIPAGPVFYGPLIQQKWGITYMWGIEVYGHTLHTFGALIYGFPLVLFIYIPSVMLCTAHNDMMRLQMKLHFAKTIKTERGVVLTDMEYEELWKNQGLWRRVWYPFIDRYHFLRLTKSTAILSLVIVFGGGLVSYSHLKYYGADSWFLAPSVAYLWILAIIRICSEYTTSYNYFCKCRGEERKRWLVH